MDTREASGGTISVPEMSSSTFLPNCWIDDQYEDMLFWIDDDLIFSEMQLQEQQNPSLLQANGDHVSNNSASTSSNRVFPTSTELPRNYATDLSAGGANRYVFKTKSEVDVLDDGYKWRKYGKKMVKNSPYPRNYYHCSYEGCNVKRRVERDREDPCYIITTYEGVHNHPVPSSATST